MKRSFLFAFFCCLCFALQAQSPAPEDNLVFGKSVPGYLQKVIKKGKVTINGVQSLTSEPEIIPFQKRQYRNYGPAMRIHPEAVVYFGAYITGRPEIDDSFCNGLPNRTPSLFGIRGGSEAMGGPTAEQSLLSTK